MSAKAKAKSCPDLSGSEGGSAGGGGGAEDAEPLDGLTAAQARAVPAVAHEPTMARAAEVAGVSVRTLQRWQNDPVFHAAVLAARKEAYSQAVGVSQKYAAAAVATFVRVMHDAAAPAGARVSAAVALMKVAKEGVELDDLAERVRGLERAARGEAGWAQAQPPGRPAMRLVGQEGEQRKGTEGRDERPEDE